MPEQKWIPPLREPEPDEPDQSLYVPRHIPHHPWEALAETPYNTEAAHNLGLHEDELDAKASEFSHGPHREPAWITTRANLQRRYSTPAEGGRYHGKTPRVQRIITTG